MTNTIIRVENLGKKYLIKHQQQGSDTALRDIIADKVKSLGKRIISPWNHKKSSTFSTTEEFWALKDVSFEVNQGEVIGIIGRNGAGKTTLLKILSRITEPTTGRFRIKGRASSLLEVGTGFHPELTGRENTFLNGAILGMKKAEIKRKFDEIVAFAEVEKFLDTPVKRYSSGMYVRLAFAVAAHLEPDILIVDEVLAVGDAAFQKKCLGKMNDVSRKGRTILFVSHNMDSILSLCSSVYVLNSGRISPCFKPDEGVRRYFSADIIHPLEKRSRFQNNNRSSVIQKLEIEDDEGNKNIIPTGKGVLFDIELRNFQDTNGLYCGISIKNKLNQRVVIFHMRHHANLILRPTNFAQVSCYVPSLTLVPGNYSVDIIVGDGINVIEKVEQAARIEVIFNDILGTGRIPPGSQGDVVMPCKWGSKQAYPI